MTTVNEKRLTEIAAKHGYDDAEYCPLDDQVTISRDDGEEGFVLVRTSAGWIAGHSDAYNGVHITNREDGSIKHVVDIERFAAENKFDPAYAFFQTPEAALVDVLDYGIEAYLL